MRVEKFFLFFDWPRKLFSFKKGGTEYGVGMIPLGGYVKISGIVDESMDKEQMREAPKPWEFRSKPVWQRMIVMVGGVTMNVLLAILIYSGLVGLYGETKVSNKAVQKLYVLEGSLGDSLGFESGDKLLTFMGQPIQYFDEVATPGILLEDNAWYEVERSGQRVKITVPNGMINYFAEIQEDPIKASVLMPWVGNRVWVDTTGAAPTAKGLGIRTGDRIVGFQGKEIVTFEQFLRLLTKEKMLLGETEKKTFRFTFSRTGQDSTTTYEVKVPLGKTDQLGLGSADTLATEQKSYGFLGSIGRGTALAFSAVSQNLKGLGKVFSGDADVTKSLSGP
ncbi:MAG: site-2 protease family protein, partial [Sphingobacteriia bacterium]